jgi:hypothetical protein
VGAQALDEARDFQAHERVIDAIPGEDIPKTPSYDQRNLLC